MPVSSSLAGLRARIDAIERRTPEGGLRPSVHARLRPGEDGAEAAFSFGLAALDGCFSLAGLPFGAHQIARSPGEDAPALLFALLMTARRFRADPSAQALVVQEQAALNEAGALYGPGLMALGLDPGRLALATARAGAEALRIVDEAVRSGAVSVVLAEAPRAAPRIDLAVTQRLNLYGRQTSTLTLLVTPDLDATSAAMTRWRVRAGPSTAARSYLGPPALDLDLVRNRLGPVGRFLVEWSSDDVVFRPPAPLRAPVVRPPVHRPDALVPARRRGAGPGGDAPQRLAALGGR